MAVVLWQQDLAVSFLGLLDLINKVQPPGPVHSREVILGIFWEETFFCNRKQPDGPAVGFGQLQMKDTAWQLKQKWGMTVNEGLILGDPQFSVTCTCRILRWFVEVANYSPRAALNAYAGVKTRPENANAVSAWLRCEAALQQIGGNSAFTTDNVKAALNACKKVLDSEQSFWDFILKGLPAPTP
jgi:hypothetical protein